MGPASDSSAPVPSASSTRPSAGEDRVEPPEPCPAAPPSSGPARRRQRRLHERTRARASSCRHRARLPRARGAARRGAAHPPTRSAGARVGVARPTNGLSYWRSSMAGSGTEPTLGPAWAARRISSTSARVAADGATASVAAEAACEALVRRERARVLPRPCEAGDQPPASFLVERVECSGRAAVANRGGQIALALSRGSERLERLGQAAVVLRAGLENPLVIDPGQQLADADLGPRRLAGPRRATRQTRARRPTARRQSATRPTVSRVVIRQPAHRPEGAAKLGERRRGDSPARSHRARLAKTARQRCRGRAHRGAARATPAAPDRGVISAASSSRPSSSSASPPINRTRSMPEA